MDYYTIEEFRAFISVAQAEAETLENKTNSINEWNYYVFFYIAFYCGMRKGEILALKWSDIEDDVIHITRSITQKLKGDDRETPPKNKSSIRNILIPLPLKRVLQAHYKRFNSIKGFTPDWRICGGERCIRDNTLGNKNTKYAGLAGIKHIRIHDYRHSHASLLANEGVNIQEIARRLGHSNVQETWNTYAHLYPREEERAIMILNKL